MELSTSLGGLVFVLGLTCCSAKGGEEASDAPIKAHHSITELSKLVALNDLSPSQATWQTSSLAKKSRLELLPNPNDWILIAEITLDAKEYAQVRAHSPALTSIQSLPRDLLAPSFRAAEYGGPSQSLVFTHSAQEFAKSPLLTGYLGFSERGHKVLLYMLAL